MKMSEALRSLGADDDLLSEDQKHFLDVNGYLSLGPVLSASEVRVFNETLANIARQEGDGAGREVHQEAGTLRLSNLVDKDPVFERCVTRPLVLAGIRQVLGDDFKLSSLNFRSALPGRGLQPLHTDWHEAVGSGNFQVCNSIWLLDDFTADNGATRILPGTQYQDKRPQDVLEDPGSSHPGEVVIEARAGTVVVFNSHTWHGGGLNRTDRPRRAMHVYFCRRHQPQQTNQRRYLAPSTVARLSEEARVILDVQSGV